MKNPLVLIFAAALAFVSTGLAADIKPFRETSFAEVTSQLDLGGSVYAYLATDQWLAGLSTNVAQLTGFLTMLPDVKDEDREKIQKAIGLASHAIQTSGIESLTGIGVSGIQVAPELYRTKFILHHRKGQGDGIFWNLSGQTPHALEGLDLLTTNTALAAFGDLDLPLLWKILEQEVRRANIPELTQALDTWPQTFEKATQLSWPKVISSLGGEVGVVITLNDSKKITLPLGQPVELPEPGLLIALKVKDDLLYDRISGELKKAGQAEITNENGLKLTAMKIPIPLPMDLQITVAASGGYLFIASSPTVVREALEVRAGKRAGLNKSAAFGDLKKYLPNDGNQFFYVDRRFAGTIQAIQKEMLTRDNNPIFQSDFMKKYLFERPPTYGLSISRRTATGREAVSVGNQEPATTLVAAPAVGAVAIGAAMILPALAKAKGKAQSISCINNMKQLGLAFRIWEGDHGDQFPFNVAQSKGGTREFCDLNSEGYDLASYRHFQVMSNELSRPIILVCPEDPSKQVAANFASLQPANVSYLVRSGKEVDDEHPQAILTYCPIHHHIGYADGSVVAGKKED